MTARVHANESKVAPTSQGMGRVVGESKDGSVDRSSSQQWAAATATKRVQSPARKRVSIFINHKVTQIVITLFVVGHLLRRQDRMAAVLAEQERDRQRMIDFAQSASDWFWETDADLRVTYLSAGYEAGTGLSAADMLGKSIWNVKGEMDSDALARHRRTFQDRQPFRGVEYARHTSTGATRYFRVSGIPLFDGNLFLGYRGTGSDITATKSIEVELERQQLIFR